VDIPIAEGVAVAFDAFEVRMPSKHALGDEWVPDAIRVGRGHDSRARLIECSLEAEYLLHHVLISKTTGTTLQRMSIAR
jgi:hypothetical protein